MAVNKPSHPVKEFYRRAPDVYTYLLNNSHQLVPAEVPLVEDGCLRITNLCAYAPDGVICGYDFQIVGTHIKQDKNFLGCWIQEFDDVKEGRLPMPFELVHKLHGVLIFEHPLGCSMAIASDLDPAMMELFNGS